MSTDIEFETGQIVRLKSEGGGLILLSEATVFLMVFTLVSGSREKSSSKGMSKLRV